MSTAELTTRQRFQVEMARATGDDLAARHDVPCIVCQRPDARLVAVWEVGAAFARTLGVAEGKQRIYFYKICRKCHRKAVRGNRWVRQFIDAAILAREHGDSIVYLGADGMPIVGMQED